VELSVAGSAAQAQEQTQNAIAVSVLRKSLDLSAEQGAELAKLMDQSSGLGLRVDLHG
jgi:hypothetical protein